MVYIRKTNPLDRKRTHINVYFRWLAAHVQTEPAVQTGICLLDFDFRACFAQLNYSRESLLKRASNLSYVIPMAFYKRWPYRVSCKSLYVYILKEWDKINS